MTDLVDRYGFPDREVVSSIALSLPQTLVSIQHTCKTLQDNVRKVKTYFEQVMSPPNIIRLIDDINTWIQDSQRASG